MSIYELPPEDVNVLNQIDKGKVYADYFFSRAKDFRWFYPLKEKGYFEPIKNPAPIEDEKAVRIPYWRVLDYLQALARQWSTNAEIVKELLAIIDAVSRHRDAGGKAIDNYHTWSSFIKILSCLPAAQIPLDILDHMPTWLDSHFDTSLTTSAITEELLPHIIKSAKDMELESNPHGNDQVTKIIDALTAIKWLKRGTKSGYYIGHEMEEPALAGDAYWILEALTRKGLAQEIAALETINPTMLVAQRAKELLLCRMNQCKKVVEHDGRYYEILMQLDKEGLATVDIYPTKDKYASGIFEQPEKIAKITMQHIDFIDYQSTGAFGELSNFAVELRKRLTDARCKAIVSNINDRELTYLYYWLYEDYSNISIKDLSYLEDWHYSEAPEILMVILKELIIERARARPHLSTDILRSLGSPNYQFYIFRRILFLAICENWHEFGSIFWEIFEQPGNNILLSLHAYEAELYYLLEKVAAILSEEEASKIRTMIEKGPVDLRPDEDDASNRHNYFKQKWFYALRESKWLSDEYVKYEKLTKSKVELPFREPSVFVGHGKPPLTPDEIINMPIEDLAVRLSEFRNIDDWKGPNVNAFAESLGAAVISKPDRFVNSMQQMGDIGYLYIYEILNGLREAWKEQKPFEWNKLIAFLLQYFERKEFWEGSMVVVGDHYPVRANWVIGSAGWLIQEGTISDANAFDEKANNNVAKLLQLIWHKINENSMREESDITDRPVDYAANSTTGKILLATVYLALRIGRLSKKSGQVDENKWAFDLDKIFIDAFENNIPEAFIIFGWMLGQFTFLNKSWADERMKALLGVNNFKQWSLFMYGYLFGSLNNILQYERMIDHYKKALETPIPGQDAEDLLVRHIGLAYLANLANFPADDLLKQLIADWNYARMEKIIHFFERQNVAGLNAPENGTNIVIDKILAFRRIIYDKYKDKNASELDDYDKDLLSETASLIVFIPIVNSDNLPWLMQVAPYIHRKFNSPEFIEHLNRLKDKGIPKQTAGYIADIYMEMLKAYKPDYDKEKIISTIRFIYQNDNKAKAKEICDQYLKSGNLFLRPLCGEFNLDES